MTPAPSPTTELLRFATAGSVDDGKSTLIGRLLHDSRQILDDQLAHVADVSKRRNGNGRLDLALLTDGLRAERERGITIDVAYRHFTTPRRRFIVADSPGHAEFTRNMVTGASTADVAVILVDASRGVAEQSRRHTCVAGLLRIPHVVVCVNKMDLVDFDEGVFEEIVEELSDFASRLDIVDLVFVPISALNGDNVVERSERMPWYQGPPLLYHLEHVHIASDRNLSDRRLPVQWVIEGDDGYAAAAGQVAGGVFQPGDEVVALPSGDRARVERIDTYDGPVESAFPPMGVALVLEGGHTPARGEMIVGADELPRVSDRFEAMLCWMAGRPLRAGERLLAKHATRTIGVEVSDLLHRLDVETLAREEAPVELDLNDIARVRLRADGPLPHDPFPRNRATGSFILIDPATNDTVAAGMIAR